MNQCRTLIPRYLSRSVKSPRRASHPPSAEEGEWSADGVMVGGVCWSILTYESSWCVCMRPPSDLQQQSTPAPLSLLLWHTLPAPLAHKAWSNVPHCLLSSSLGVV